MTIINTTTGEVVDLDAPAAERRAERITLRLDAIAENYRMVLPMIREAIEKRDDLALGYRSPGDYVSDRFGQALAGLGVDVRRAVVGELTEAGLSTRAIAPVVGVSPKTISLDQRVTRVTPDPTSFAEHTANHQTSCGTSDITAPQDPASAEEMTEGAGTPEPPAPRPPVVGIDGKAYTRPTPKPSAPVRGMTDIDMAVEYVETVARNLTVLSQLTVPERRIALRQAFPIALGKVSPAQTDRFTPAQMRAVADGLHDLADEWDLFDV